MAMMSLDDACRLIPLHEVHDEAKVDGLVESILANGWQGRPLLAVEWGDGRQALTGTHRLAALVEIRRMRDRNELTDEQDALVAGLRVPVLVVERQDDDELITARDNEERLEVCERRGLGDAAQILRAEIEANEANEASKAAASATDTVEFTG